MINYLKEKMKKGIYVNLFDIVNNNCFKEFIKEGEINFQDSNGDTLLFKAFTSEQTELLLKAGANPNIQNNNGSTPLHWVISTEQMKLLLKAGANPNIQTDYGLTPLHFSKNVEQTKLLLEAGANPNIQNNYGNTPLHYSVSIDQVIEILKVSTSSLFIRNNRKEFPEQFYFYWGNKPKELRLFLRITRLILTIHRIKSLQNRIKERYSRPTHPITIKRMCLLEMIIKYNYFWHK